MPGIDSGFWGCRFSGGSVLFDGQSVLDMSLEQKVGALLTLGFNGTILTPNIISYVTEYHCGGLRVTPPARISHSFDPDRFDSRATRDCIGLASPAGR